MKKLIYCMILSSVLVTGCDDTVKMVKRDPVVIFEVDGCEYIKIEGGRYGWGSHKGNCKFCAERAKNNCK